ncbi:MAG: Crp/Fnr family transcriptional regulator [Phenylobacterium sp. RIFCSPHIGHO2_01_FULL_70_10]|nr:MAG: Crp/Fnr family transcriptional regulator [Phenylobacterium sp. RIFCSPHIGHO2_01_FULL_70_10]
MVTPHISILRSTELFQGLDDEALKDVLDCGQTQRLTKGTAAFRQGDPGATCHSLVHGRVKIAQTRPDGGQFVIRFIGPGEMFGTVAALMGQPFPADAVAVVDSIQVVWAVEAMRELMLRHPDIAIRATSAVGGRVKELQSRLGEMGAARVEQRIARALVRLVRQAGRRTDEGVEIDFPITRQELAEMTGSTLHTVSRTLASWEAQGLLDSSRRRITVRRPHALVALAEDLPGSTEE